MPRSFLYHCISPTSAADVFTTNPDEAEILSRKGYITTAKSIQPRIHRYTKGVQQ